MTLIKKALERLDIDSIEARYNKLQFYNETDPYCELAYLVVEIPTLIARIRELETT